jgi:hypothetical protein
MIDSKSYPYTKPYRVDRVSGSGVHDCVAATRGRTHVLELLFLMATVAIQTVKGWPEGTAAVDSVSMQSETAKSSFVNGCYAWAAGGNLLANMYTMLATRLTENNILPAHMSH